MLNKSEPSRFLNKSMTIISVLGDGGVYLCTGNLSIPQRKHAKTNHHEKVNSEY